jgi:hypothetical protein
VRECHRGHANDRHNAPARRRDGANPERDGAVHDTRMVLSARCAAQQCINARGRAVGQQRREEVSDVLGCAGGDAGCEAKCTDNPNSGVERERGNIDGWAYDEHREKRRSVGEAQAADNVQ